MRYTSHLEVADEEERYVKTGKKNCSRNVGIGCLCIYYRGNFFGSACNRKYRGNCNYKGGILSSFRTEEESDYSEWCNFSR